MLKKLSWIVISCASLVTLVFVMCGLATGSWVCGTLGPMGGVACLILLPRFTRQRRSEPAGRPPEIGKPHSVKQNSDQQVTHAPPATTTPEGLDDSEDLVHGMLRQGRYALLLRQQIAANLSPSEFEQAQAALDEAMALVPEGDVLLRVPQEDDWDDPAGDGELVHVETVFLDRYPVTNAQFRRFVEADGYSQMALWDSEIWPGVIDFVDRTGHPGPRTWSHGRCNRDEEDHPVVGVSWYEAAAYARWVGKRLPSDPEWVKAATWPVAVPGGRPVERRYPWGDAFDANRANLWDSGRHWTTSISEFPGGVSPGSVYGLIGNVWEWTSTNYGVWDQRRFEMSAPFKSLRGGAYDSYFETQANSQFQSGDVPVARKHNVGFRCAVGLCDVVHGLDKAECPSARERRCTA